MQGTGERRDRARRASRRRVLFASIFFILGFSFVFISLRRGRERAGPVPARAACGCSRRSPASSSSCSACTRWACCASAGCTARSACRWRRSRRSLFGAFLVGLAFAFGWTPCIGPILAGILAIAGTQETVGQGIRLLAVYSLGLGLPFLLTALAINQFFSVFARIRKHYHAIEVVSGAAPVAIGVLIFTEPLHAHRAVAHALPADVLGTDHLIASS